MNLRRTVVVFLLTLFATGNAAAVVTVYWTSRDAATVNVANVNTQQTQVIVSSTGGRLQDIDLDSSTGVLYFADWGGAQGTINRVNPNGSGLAVVHTAAQPAIHQLAIDESSQRIYFTRARSAIGREISRVDVSGANYTQLLTGVGVGSGNGHFWSGLAIDVANDAIYWGDIGIAALPPNDGAVNVMTLTGGSPTTLSPHVDGRGRGFAIDLPSQTIFLTAHNPLSPGTGGGLFSYHIPSGTLTQLINDPATGYWDVEIDPATQRIWYTDYGRSQIRSADFSGGNVVVELSNLSGVYGLALQLDGQQPARATFGVEKDFNDNNPAEVEVTISCNTGLPLQQTTSISEGDGVVFVVRDFNDGQMDCEITEVVPAGYSVNYFDGTTNSSVSCEFNNVSFGQASTCDITNSLQQVTVDVTKVWIDENPRFNPQNAAQANYSCSGEVTGGPFGGEVAGSLFFNGTPDTDTESFTVYPDWDGFTTCTISESFLEGGVEADDSACQGLSVTPGSGASCTIVNTRLFEGIPTLSRHGLALLVLLMLGLGLVAYRRLV